MGNDPTMFGGNMRNSMEDQNRSGMEDISNGSLNTRRITNAGQNMNP